MNIGDTNPDVQKHIEKTIENAREATGHDLRHTVFVAVYVDGMLEFAGANATNIIPTREQAKTQAASILYRMHTFGTCCAAEKKDLAEAAGE